MAATVAECTWPPRKNWPRHSVCQMCSIRAGSMPDEDRAVGVNEALEGQLFTVDAGLAQTGQPLVGIDLHEGVVPFRPLLVVDQESL